MMAYHTGATFYPGGDDSYYMPEVVSPQPQSAAETTVNMQEHVAQMDQQAASWRNTQTPHPQTYNISQNNGMWNQPISAGYQGPHDNSYSNGIMTPQPYQQAQYQAPKAPVEQPNFSPFPQLRNRGPNVPPGDEEREASLEAAREGVLSSNDFEMQLTWAQDALSYVEVAIQNEANVSATQGARPRTPRVEHMLRVDALKVVEFLASQSHPKAEFMKGTWLEFGKFGYRIDKREAYNCYIRASERGYARAFYRIGMQFENSNEAQKAIKHYQQGVEAGDAASCYRLGMMQLLGQHGLPRDYNRGIYLIQTAAQKADDNAPQGAYVLGMLQAGELSQVSIPESVLPKNLWQARSNIEKAAFLGFAKAQLRMGQAYELGDFECHFDPVLSLHYNALAARQGETEAEMAISKWFLCGEEGVFEKNEEMAFTYAQRAAVAGLATAQFAMGYFYEVGIYVSTDLKRAREWYQKADENGNADARKRIEAVSRSKTISRKDHESVALQRIREQHAAAERAPTLPSLPEFSTAPLMPEKPMSPTLDMPDPARISLNSTPGPQRPTSTAPYPVGNPSLNAPSPNVRPTSAFGINPRLQQQQQPQQQSQYPPGPVGRPDPYRMSSAPSIAYPSADPNQPYRPDGRRPSGQQAAYPPQPRPQGPPQTRPSTTSPYLGAQNPGTYRPVGPQTPTSPRPPKGADIGFSAPPDPRPDRKEQRRPLPSQQGQQVASAGAGLRPPQPSAISKPSQSNHTRPQQPQLQTESKLHQGNNNIQPAHLTPSKPNSSAPPTPRPDQQKPPTLAAASAAVSRPPGKGPKTFEEMGVPQGKKESECAVM